jgi:hypothetical protein
MSAPAMTKLHRMVDNLLTAALHTLITPMEDEEGLAADMVVQIVYHEGQRYQCWVRPWEIQGRNLIVGVRIRRNKEPITQLLRPQLEQTIAHNFGPDAECIGPHGSAVWLDFSLGFVMPRPKAEIEFVPVAED